MQGWNVCSHRSVFSRKACDHFAVKVSAGKTVNRLNWSTRNRQGTFRRTAVLLV